jgi:hypothetical protein
MTPLVIEQRLHLLVCPRCSTSTCASLPADVDASFYGPLFSVLVGLLGAVPFPLSFSKAQVLVEQLSGRGDTRADQRHAESAHLGGPGLCSSAAAGLCQ